MTGMAWNRIISAAKCRAVAFPAELAGYLVLGVTDALAGGSAVPKPEDISLDREGRVGLLSAAPYERGEANSCLRDLLKTALAVSSSPSSALNRLVSTGGDEPERTDFARLLQKALIPVNRGAARRALARLYRELIRVESLADSGDERPAAVPLDAPSDEQACGERSASRGRVDERRGAEPPCPSLQPIVDGEDPGSESVGAGAVEARLQLRSEAAEFRADSESSAPLEPTSCAEPRSAPSMSHDPDSLEPTSCAEPTMARTAAAANHAVATDLGPDAARVPACCEVADGAARELVTLSVHVPEIPDLLVPHQGMDVVAPVAVRLAGSPATRRVAVNQVAEPRSQSTGALGEPSASWAVPTRIEESEAERELTVALRDLPPNRRADEAIRETTLVLAPVSVAPQERTMPLPGVSTVQQLAGPGGSMEPFSILAPEPTAALPLVRRRRDAPLALQLECPGVVDWDRTEMDASVESLEGGFRQGESRHEQPAATAGPLCVALSSSTAGVCDDPMVELAPVELEQDWPAAPSKVAQPGPVGEVSDEFIEELDPADLVEERPIAQALPESGNHECAISGQDFTWQPEASVDVDFEECGSLDEATRRLFSGESRRDASVAVEKRDVSPIAETFYCGEKWIAPTTYSSIEGLLDQFSVEPLWSDQDLSCGLRLVAGVEIDAEGPLRESFPAVEPIHPEQQEPTRRLGPVRKLAASG